MVSVYPVQTSATCHSPVKKARMNVLQSPGGVTVRNGAMRASPSKTLVHRRPTTASALSRKAGQVDTIQNLDITQVSGPIAAPKPDDSQPSSIIPPQVITAGRRTMLGLGAMATCSCCQEAMAAPSRPKPAAAWSYGQQDRPAAWKGMCAVGKMQSPVNIMLGEADAAAKAMPLAMDYRVLKNASIKNTGHGTQINVPPGNLLAVGDDMYQMVQYHFHTPAEHAFDGRRAPMEAHLVHKNMRTGDLAVVGCMLESDIEYSVALDQALKVVPGLVGASAMVNLNEGTFESMLPAGAQIKGIIPNESRGVKGPLEYVHYRGSLTTPPCSEVVQWFVLLGPAGVTATQVLDFQRLLGGELTLDTNSRPLQAMYGREFDAESITDITQAADSSH